MAFPGDLAAESFTGNARMIAHDHMEDVGKLWALVMVNTL